MHELSDEVLASVHPLLTSDVRKVLTVEGALNSRSTIGATGPKALADQLSAANTEMDAFMDLIFAQRRAFSEMMGE